MSPGHSIIPPPTKFTMERNPILLTFVHLAVRHTCIITFPSRVNLSCEPKKAFLLDILILKKLTGYTFLVNSVWLTVFMLNSTPLLWWVVSSRLWERNNSITAQLLSLLKPNWNPNQLFWPSKLQKSSWMNPQHVEATNTSNSASSTIYSKSTTLWQYNWFTAYTQLHHL